MKAKAVWMIGKEQTEIREIEVGKPRDGQVQVRIKACGVCAWDAYLFRGISLEEGYPFQFGHEGVGIIQEVGPLVQGYKEGDKVFVAGGSHLMAEVVNVPVNCIAKINQPVETDEDYAKWVAEPIVCVVNSMKNCPINPGDRVVLIGTGYMGMLNVQGMQVMPVGELICFDLDEKRLAMAKKYGADEVYQIGTEASDKKIAEIIAQGGVEVVIECSSSADGFDLANKFLKTSGALNMFAWHRAERTFDGTPWHLKGIRIYNTAPNIDKHNTDNIIPTERLISKGVFNQEELITHMVPYSEVQEILEIASKHAEGYIKGVVLF